MPRQAVRSKSQDGRLARLLKFDLSMQRLCSQSRQLSLAGIDAGEEQSVPAIIGIDEVGRGCLAGPVVAAAVLLPEIDPASKLAETLSRLNDSKALSPEERTVIGAIVKQVAVCAIAEASVEEIDEINILQASLLAMKRARQALLAVSPAVLLVDGNKKIPGLKDRQIPLVKGDSQSASIAAASVIAKVYRDALMCRLAESFPHYRWEQNKGYGSTRHRQAIKQHGLTVWHRRSFRVDCAE